MGRRGRKKETIKAAMVRKTYYLPVQLVEEVKKFCREYCYSETELVRAALWEFIASRRAGAEGSAK